MREKQELLQKILENSKSKLNAKNKMLHICNIANNPNVIIILIINTIHELKLKIQEALPLKNQLINSSKC